MSKMSKRKERKIVAKTANGIEIHLGIDSYTRGLLEDVDSDHLVEGISQIPFDSNMTVQRFTVTFDENIGHTYCIKTSIANVPVYNVYQVGQSGTTPMVFGVDPLRTDKLTFTIKRRKNFFYVCGAYYGEASPLMPWSKSISNDLERRESEEFWSTHALIWHKACIDWDRTSL